MRYGPIPESASELRLLQTAGGQRVPFDTLVAPMQTKCLMLAVRLGIFELMSHSSCSCTELAERLDFDEAVLSLLLRMLWGAGYLSREGGGYGLTPLARDHLLRSSRASHVAHTALCEFLWGAIGNMETALREGAGIDVHGYLADVDAWQTYQAAMLEGAWTMARLMVPFIPVSHGALRLLDIGGSHGLYGALICRAHPPMKAEVLELPAAVAHAHSLAKSAGLADVVSHRAGDVLQIDLGEGFDVILLNNILHHFDTQQSRATIERAFRALAPGGTIAVLEYEPPCDRGPPDPLSDTAALLFHAVFGGRCHEAEDYCKWLEESGACDVQVRRSVLIAQHCIIVARAAGRA